MMVTVYHYHRDIYGDVVNDQTAFIWSLAVDEFGFEIPLPLCRADGHDAMGNAHYSMTCDGVH
ncbi:hypothetical protein BX589_12031 [Paraburkholderia fungorum]|jgi:hypothetical protein|uniref:hypothetical protein n=1 Tax=Paraburkholderia fungorum TaxID=134537 RepID=UPI000D05B89F|nr:hypothetical protein [Paraburkholderia fungorum]PRZ51190.1 hypothetical protein BX589_12031 [Paraburkholderia fungorum]